MTNVPKNKWIVPRSYEVTEYAEPFCKEARVQLDDPLLDCVLEASLCQPPELDYARISLETAEKRVRYLRACVPQLRDYDDIEVLQLVGKALDAHADALIEQRQRSWTCGQT